MTVNHHYSPPVPVWCGSHLFVGDVDGSAEDDPLHHLAAGRSGQRAGVAVVTSQGGGQQVFQHKGLQDSFFFYKREVRRSIQQTYTLFHFKPQRADDLEQIQVLLFNSRRFKLLISFTLSLPCSVSPY